MSYYSAVGTTAVGVGMIAYGSYKCMTARETATEQKTLALKSLKLGAAILALGVFSLYANDFNRADSVPQLPQTPLKPLPTCLSHVDNVFSKTSICPIEKLKEILNANPDSKVAQAFKILEDHQELSCSNYLPWNDNYRGFTDYIDTIRPEYLDKPVMWGIDACGRLYMAIKYVCDQTNEGAVALFQKSAGCMDWMAVGGHFKPAGCWSLGPLEYPYNAEFLGNLQNFFLGGKIEAPLHERVTVLTLAK